MFKYNLGDGADLRILEIRHAQEFLDFVAENRSYLGEWLGWAHTITPVEAARGFIRRGVTRYEEDGLPWVGIWLNDRMAGGILFFPVEEYIRATEIGYWLGEQTAGRGLMTRSIRAMLGFVFDDLQLNRVGLMAEVSKKRSRALAERLGFTFEGIDKAGSTAKNWWTWQCILSWLVIGITYNEKMAPIDQKIEQLEAEVSQLNQTLTLQASLAPESPSSGAGR